MSWRVCHQCVLVHKQADKSSQEQIPQADKIAVNLDTTSAASTTNGNGASMQRQKLVHTARMQHAVLYG